MRVPRRQFLHLAAGAAALPALSRMAGAQAYPMRPITIVVPFSAGGPTDTLARILAEQMRTLLVGEFVLGYEASGWQGIGAPRNTPTEIVDKLNQEISVALADPKMKARLADLGSTAFVSSPADFSKFIAEFTERWGKIIRSANIKAD
jgi:tripartite-type tricarboxylate transporter receptor subunit TctC